MVNKETSPLKGAPFKKDWTEGSIIRNLLLLCWPMVLMETLFVTSQVADMIWVGRLGSTAIAGVGIANMVLMLVMSMDMGIIMGVRALVARFIGAGDIEGANHVAGQAFVLSTTWGLLITVIGLSLAEPLIGIFGMEAEVTALGINYIRVMFAGWVAMDILVMGLYVIQSSGDTKTPLVIESLIRVVHLTLCPLLVLGVWIFPQMGVTGAALANVISQCLGVFLVFWLLLGGYTRLRPALRDFKPDPGIMWRILKIGIPALFMSLQRSLGNFMLTWFIAPFGTLAVAAHSIASRAEMFLCLPGLGFGMGAGVLVGQNLGAGRPDRAEKTGWLALGFLEAFMVVCSAAILLWAENIMGVFTTDPGLVQLGGIFLRIASAGYIVMAFVSVLQSCIAGAGDTIPTMIISVAMIWAVQLPLAFLLPRYTSLGVYGLRWAIVANILAGAIAYIIYFKLGRWKAKKV